MGIKINTHDVWACLAEVGRSISNSVGIISNTRVSEEDVTMKGCLPPLCAGINFNTRVAEVEPC